MKNQTPSNKNQNMLTKSLTFTADYNSFKRKGEFDFFAEIQAGRITKIHEYFQSHKDEIPLLVNSQDNSAKTALFYAILFLYLLTHSANPYIIDSDKQTIFHLACFFGRDECIGLFLNYKKHLMRARLTHFLRQKLIEYKIKKSALVQTQIGKGEEARKIEAIKNELKNELESEIYREREEWMETMKTDGHERCPIHYSAFSKYTKCFATAKLLLEPHAEKENWHDFLNLFEEIQLLESSKEKRIDPRHYTNIFQILSSFFPLPPPLPLPLPSLLNSLDIHGYTPLHIASFHGDYLLLKYLILLGGDPNLKDGKSKKEVLYFAMNDEVRNSVGGLVEAARKGDIGRVKELVNCGKEINEKKSVFGVAPIHNAIEFCHRNQDLSCLKTILTCEADINAFDSNGWTALHRACELGDPYLVSYLLSKNADQQKFSNKGLYPIHIAALNDKYEIIRILFEDKNNEGDLKKETFFKNLRSTSILEVKNDKGETPLIIAAKKGNVASMKTILNFGGDFYAIDKLGWSSLHHASFNHHKDAVNLLCKSDADNDELRNFKNCQGKTAFELANKEEVKLAFQTLWRASIEGDLDTLRRLIILEENINDQTYSNKYTSLMLAAKYNNYLIVHFLLEKGAREDLTDANGLTAKDHANNLNVRNLVFMKMKKNMEIKDKKSIESKEMKEKRLFMEKKQLEVSRKIKKLLANEEEI